MAYELTIRDVENELSHGCDGALNDMTVACRALALRSMYVPGHGVFIPTQEMIAEALLNVLDALKED